MNFKVLTYPLNITVCPKSLGPFYTVTNNIEWDKTSWTYSMIPITDKIILGYTVYNIDIGVYHNRFMFCKVQLYYLKLNIYIMKNRL